jgi:hypothetical protein
VVERAEWRANATQLAAPAEHDALRESREASVARPSMRIERRVDGSVVRLRFDPASHGDTSTAHLAT